MHEVVQSRLQKTYLVMLKTGMCDLFLIRQLGIASSFALKLESVLIKSLSREGLDLVDNVPRL